MKATNYTYNFILPFFTADDELRPAMSHAHAEGGYVYATDAHILIRIPEKNLAKKYSPVEKYPNAAKLLSEALERPDNQTATIQVDDLVRVLTKAKWGKEMEGDECPDCNGNGTEKCPECHHEHDCERCDGKGEIHRRIKQFSLLEDEGFFKVGIGVQVFRATFLHVIVLAARMLKTDEIEYRATNNAGECGVFSFAGIDILLMPYLAQDSDEVITTHA